MRFGFGATSRRARSIADGRWAIHQASRFLLAAFISRMRTVSVRRGPHYQRPNRMPHCAITGPMAFIYDFFSWLAAFKIALSSLAFLKAHIINAGHHFKAHQDVMCDT